MSQFQKNLDLAYKTLFDLRRFDELTKAELETLEDEKNALMYATRAFSRTISALNADRKAIEDRLSKLKPGSDAYLLGQADLQHCKNHIKIAEKAWYSGKKKILKLISTITNTNASNSQTRRAIVAKLTPLARRITTSAQESRKVLVEQVLETEPVKQLCQVTEKLSEWNKKKRSLVSSDESASPSKRTRHAPMSVRWHKVKNKFQLYVGGRHRGYFGTMTSAWTEAAHLLKMPVAIVDCSLTRQKE